jgi:hypothetical protein
MTLPICEERVYAEPRLTLRGMHALWVPPAWRQHGKEEMRPDYISTIKNVLKGTTNVGRLHQLLVTHRTLCDLQSLFYRKLIPLRWFKLHGILM